VFPLLLQVVVSDHLGIESEFAYFVRLPLGCFPTLQMNLDRYVSVRVGPTALFSVLICCRNARSFCWYLLAAMTSQF